MAYVANEFPLSGVRVVDLTTYIAAPSCGRALAAMGADVIKIEPLGGDDYRNGGKNMGIPIDEECAPLFDSVNGGKRLISLNLKDPRTRPIVEKLVKSADIFVTNMREKSLKKLGLDYETLRELNPRMVYAHTTGFGTEGPDAPRPGYDVTSFMARSGLFTSFMPPDGKPMTIPNSLGDMITGMSMTIGLLGAYAGAKRTGKGEFVTSSLFGSACWVFNHTMIGTQFGYKLPRSWEEPVDTAVIHQYKAKDGRWIQVCVFDTKLQQLAALDDILGGGIFTDERFDTKEKRQENITELVHVIQDRFSQYDSAYLAEQFSKREVVYEMINAIGDLPNDEQARINGYVSEVVYPARDNASVWLGMPPLFFESAGKPAKASRAGRVGEHTVEIMQELGYSEAEIKELYDGKAINISPAKLAELN
ncbi:MAG: CoA transferase [Ruminococcaceae bacterium]|nr:CoA transferase [Oscillospiraceae bacterium]